MCSVTQHQCRRRQMCGKLSQIQPVYSLLSVTNNDLSWVNYLFMARFQHISLYSDEKNIVQLCSVFQHQCRRRQMCGKFSSFPPAPCFLSVTKNDFSLMNNLIMAKFQLMRMSTYAKNKVLMCSVTQHQCRRRQMCGKF